MTAFARHALGATLRKQRSQARQNQKDLLISMSTGTICRRNGERLSQENCHRTDFWMTSLVWQRETGITPRANLFLAHGTATSAKSGLKRFPSSMKRFAVHPQHRRLRAEKKSTTLGTDKILRATGGKRAMDAV